MKTIHALWQSFQKVAIPRNAHFQQHLDMKRSFYAGASAILHIIQHLEDDATDDEIAAALDTLTAEIDSYTKQLAGEMN